MNEHSYLDTVLPLTPKQVERFQSHGFIHIRGAFAPPVIDEWRPRLVASAHRENLETLPIEERDTYGKAFLQTTNLWETDPVVRPFVFSRRLAQLASDLLQVDRVRLYHDQALFKEPGGGHTPWHADQHYWPFSTDRAITVWIPLVDVPLSMGPLSFAKGSQSLSEGRQFSIGDEGDQEIARVLEAGDTEFVEEAYAVGDVSFHLGTTLHRAGANSTENERAVMTMIYMDADMRLQEPANESQRRDWERWCPGVEVGSVCDSVLNPMLC